MGNLCIVKLGGSIITDKKAGRPVLLARRVKEIACELAQVIAKRKPPRLILLYGAGSYGHPVAHRYKLLDQPLSKYTLIGVGYTTASVRELGTRLAEILLDAGIPVVPLQTSSFVSMRKGRLHFANISTIENILEHGGVPLLGGDVVFAGRRTAIASADALAVELSRKFKKAHLYFATDVDGVYANFPPQNNERPLRQLERSAVKDLLQTQRSKITRSDITGAMPGKLRELLRARNTNATIFNGSKQNSLSGALFGQDKGTKVSL